MHVYTIANSGTAMELQRIEQIILNDPLLVQKPNRQAKFLLAVRDAASQLYVKTDQGNILKTDANGITALFTSGLSPMEGADALGVLEIATGRMREAATYAITCELHKRKWLKLCEQLCQKIDELKKSQPWTNCRGGYR
jgi:hypothetical protein